VTSRVRVPGTRPRLCRALDCVSAAARVVAS
jgi:hypothetical protein